MAEGIIFRDDSGNSVTVEFSTQVPPTAPSTWIAVPEVFSVTQNSEAADRIPMEHFGSTKKEFRSGLAGDGSFSFQANLVPTATAGSPLAAQAQIQIMALKASGQRRWWRVVYPKAVDTSSTRFTQQWAGSVETTSVGEGSTTNRFVFSFDVLVNSDFTEEPEVRAP